jgi:RNA polymerase sigma-70 factor (ECF subfamily)
VADGEPSDIELVRDFQSGREQAFNQLVLRHRQGVFTTAAGILGNAQDADDVAQDVFIKVYTTIGDFRGESAFFTWLYRITVNLCLNHLRSRKTRQFIGVDELEGLLQASERADEPAAEKELAAKLHAAIAELPEKQRAVFILRYFQELPHADIAKIMDRDVGTIKANYFQAVRKLREKLGSYIQGGE